MNKLISTDLNGFPFVLDDLRFIDNGIRESFDGVHSSLLDKTLVNDGFLYSTNKPSTLLAYAEFLSVSNPTFPETFCNINGEIYLIPETTLNFSGRSVGEVYTIETDFSFDSNGTKIFEDTNTHETYQIRRAKLVLKSSIVSGTDIPVLYYDDTTIEKFVYDCNFEFLGRIGDKLNIIDFDFYKNTINGQITSLQASRDNLEGAWTTVNSSTIFGKIYINASSSHSNFASDIQLFTLGLGIGSGSWLKYKKVGKTLHVSFSFQNLILPTYTAHSVALLNVDLTGIVPSLSNILKFKSTCLGLESDFDGSSDCCIAGNVFQTSNHDNKNGSFCLVGWAPFQYSNFAFNKSYNLSSIPYASTSTLDASQTKWNFEGSFTCEIV
ncbi:hypothetical protein UFOVP105_8 [uncultured Caudovirales phage]|uniref:Uncharacterized protein n=1 Tax=uncultured Caudovirales phage TaxID=2100421 RepID=A0A6J5KZI0_9CAUD|nr:hypothetical protein UFOVP105_8 [uncultured Caudovirales phage]